MKKVGLLKRDSRYAAVTEAFKRVYGGEGARRVSMVECIYSADEPAAEFYVAQLLAYSGDRTYASIGFHAIAAGHAGLCTVLFAIPADVREYVDKLNGHHI